VIPAFAREMGLPQNRDKLWFGIRSGYAIVVAFAVLAAICHYTHVLPFSYGLGAMIALKLATNTAAWIALKKDRLALELSGLNVMADIVTMTGAIYHTGGVVSPLLPIYGIELTVIALLTNVGVTVAVGVLTWLSYAAMQALMYTGVLVAMRPVHVVAEGGVTGTYRLVALVFVALVIAIPTTFAAGILRKLREKEDALLARNRELVESVRQRSQFMANVTHELRTPIHGIVGLADLVGTGVYGPTTDKQRDAVRDIKGSALSLLRLIDDLLTLSRDDAGRLIYRASDVDLDEVVTSVMATVAFLRGTRELEVTLDAESDLPRLLTDRGKLVQVLVNLLANAVKFTPDGGHVTLRVRRAGESIELAVIDDGIGVAPSQHERIFEPFKQVDGSKERKYGGTGLGLALVKRLTAMLGGQIRVESELGHGATFTVTLPIVGPPSMRVTGEHSVVTLTESARDPDPADTSPPRGS
jgi:signal transduction histidine kinase